MATMRASVLMRAQDIELQERQIPTPAPDEVLVRVTAVGVCGSDVHFYREGHLGRWSVDSPLVLGHESGGVITAVGEQVAATRIGERVSIEPQRPSTSSAETMRGDYHLDPHMVFYAVPGTDGAFQEYVTIQSHFAHPVPDEVSDHAAALMEPLSVGIAALRKASVGPGSRLLITGAGAVGIAIAQVARASGVSEIIVSEPSAQRREAALRLGASVAVDPAVTALEALEVDAFVDASGSGAAVRTGIEQVRPSGRVVLVGMGLDELALPISLIQDRELVLTGVYRYANTWPTAIALVKHRQVDLDSMVTGTFGLGAVRDALESLADPATVKSVVEPMRA